MSKVKKGDDVIIVSGAHKGKKGKVNEVNPTKNLVYVEGITKKTHKKKSEYSEGGIVDVPKSVHASNVMLLDSKGNVTRIGKKKDGDKLARFEKTTGKVLK